MEDAVGVYKLCWPKPRVEAERPQECSWTRGERAHGTTCLQHKRFPAVMQCARAAQHGVVDYAKMPLTRYARTRT